MARDPILLNHRVDLYVPSQCGICTDPLPADIRDAVLEEVKAKFDSWFGAHAEAAIKGDWKLPDGTIAREDVADVYSFCSEEALKEHAEDVDQLAVEVANKLTQDMVLRAFDNLNVALWPNTLKPPLRPKKDCACAGKAVVATAAHPAPVTIKNADLLSKMLAIQGLLRSFRSVDHARKLFCDILNYEYSKGSLPCNKWPAGVRKALEDEPEVLADQNGFKIVHLHLASERLRRTGERAVIQRIMKEFTPFYGLFIVSNRQQDRWEFVNAKSHGEDAAKLVLRRLQVGVDEVRTATERIAMVEIGEREEKDITAAAIQERHDKAFDVETVTKEFYREIADWYFWALQHKKVAYPRSVRGEQQKSVFLIRLLTRLIFCWFLREKGLIPGDLFNRRHAKELLKDFSPKAGTFYKAVLQNLFFATLNQEQNKREYRKKYEGSRDGNRGVTNLYRYANLLEDPKALLDLLRQVPFVNGGLFDCLDEVYNGKEGKPDIRLDDFSEEEQSRLCVPNELFFGEEQEVDLSEAYGDAKHKKQRVRGLIDILNRYRFTIEESTPLDQEVALDPEMLGNVFENLLASYNEETKTTARKATGAFYTPREIVSYMVDESLIAHLQTELAARQSSAKDAEARLRRLFVYDNEPHGFSPPEVDALLQAVDGVKVIDPACGSGAFPMGILHKLVFILGKLDPGNERWKARQIAKAGEIPDVTFREKAVAAIEQAFANEMDYGRKLYLIENCIYGVDIQPIAVQISKLRFFISLLVDQKVDEKAPNYGVIPLPNLETKFVAANTLIDLKRPGQQLLRNQRIDEKEAELRQVREQYFSARTPATKAKCRQRDARLRMELVELLQVDDWETTTALMLANWDPYDQNGSAEFFDPEWMFGLTKGFDVVIGNPPYIRIQTLNETNRNQVQYFKDRYRSARKGNYDIYVVFVERGLELLHPRGELAYILPHKFFNAQYGEPLRELVANGKYLRHVVHFGDQQVFPGATNYVCLLFLSRIGATECRWVSVDDLAAWLASGRCAEATLPATRVTSAAWGFATGRAADLVDKLRQMPTKLPDVAQKLFQGLVSSADDVYFLEPLDEQRGGLIHVRSRATRKEYKLEAPVVRPLCKGALDVRRYSVRPSKRVVFPYDVQQSASTGRAQLIAPSVFRRLYPRTWGYLEENKRILQAREGGKMRHDGWYGYVYPKSIPLFALAKILTPSIAAVASFALDPEGEFFFVGSGGGGGGGYGIILKEQCGLRPEYVLGLLNSRLLDYMLQQGSTPFRGGYFAYSRQFLEPLPIRTLNLSDKAQRAEHDALVRLVDHILKRKRANAVADIAAQEREIDDRVYHLYGLSPEEIKLVEAERPTDSGTTRPT